PVRLNPNLPAELERIINKALEKDRELRYQVASEMRADLKRLKREVDSGKSSAASSAAPATTPSSGSVAVAAPPSGPAVQPAVSASGPIMPATVAAPSSRKRWYILAAVLVALAAAFGGFFYTRRARALTEKDSILIADFDNKTGDEVFDGTLKQALAVQLEQSPFLNIFPDERVSQALGFMKRAPDERVTRDVAKEICQRGGLKAMLVGSITPLGAHYSLALEVVNAQTGDVLARAQKEAESKERVLEALGVAATDLRQKLGESLRSIQKFDAPINQATTSSLEALKVFALAHPRLEPDPLKQISLYKRAAELDPNFAMAYAHLAVLYQNTLQSVAASKAAQKAFDLMDRGIKTDRLEISIRYY